MSQILEVNNLKISFRTHSGKVQAVRNISFSLEQGETLCIVGESGSGKSVTSKAIMGLLAGNSIVESGRVIYDGKDLLKLTRDEMHTIRGDKISMIFQDPMSSLNPIMRVGKQITEAMLLKNKASRDHARELFNGQLKILRHYLDLAYPGDADRNAADCKTLNSFCILNTRLELAYNHAAAAAEDCLLEINDLLFLMEKKQKVDFKTLLKRIEKNLQKSFHQFTLKKDEQMTGLESRLTGFMKRRLTQEEEDGLTEALSVIRDKLDAALAGDRPDYFSIGYLLYKDPQASLDMPVSRLNEIARKKLEEEFLAYFLERVSAACDTAFRESLVKKCENVEALNAFSASLTKNGITRKQLQDAHEELSIRVEQAMNPLVISKNSAECTFSSSFQNCLKSDADPEVQKDQLRDIVNQLKIAYEQEIDGAEGFTGEDNALELIGFFRKQASLLVSCITKGMAKAKAIKLLKEVGIPDPELRYRQYPFEFSGGMRQRIVIAIALASDPEILICDEPTTALDVTIQAQILELINRIKAERKLSVIFITHNLGVVAYMADRVAVMYAGKIVEYGTVQDIFYDPRHPYTWALLSSIPDLDTTSELESIHGTPPNMIYPPKGDAFAERNKYALEIDHELEPPLFELSPTHYAATWLVHPNAPKIDRPQIVSERIERMRMRKNDGK